MKKMKWTLLVLVLALVLVGGAAAFLLLNEPPAEEEAPASSQPEEVLISRKAEEAASIEVKNAQGSFELVPADVGEEVSSQAESASSEETSSAGDSGLQFTVRDMADADEQTATQAVRSLFPMTAAKNLGAQEDLEKFGLSGSSAVTVHISYEDGTEDTLVLGDEGGQTYGNYVLKDETVYIVSSIDQAFWGGVEGFASQSE